MGKAYVIKCPKGQAWAQQFNRCEHPSIAKCTIRPVVPKPGIKPAQAEELLNTSEESSESSESESYEEYEYDYYEEVHSITDDADYIVEDVRCIPDDVDRFHPIQFMHPTDCNMFYKCFDHHAYKAQCPGGLHYSEEKEMCDYPEEANCKVGVAEAQAQEFFNSPAIPVCPKEGNVNFPVDGSFIQYFSCQGGLTYLMECENGEIFSPMTKTCQNPQTPQFPMMPFPEGMQQMPEWMQQMQGGMPQFPGGMPQFPGGMMPQFQGGMQQFPGGMPQFPGGMMPQFPGGMQQFPGGMPQFPFPMMPETPIAKPDGPKNSQTPNNKPQLPLEQPEALPEFPSWMPVPNTNVKLPELPSVEKPSHEKPTDKNEFDYKNGKQSSQCPSSDNPTKPQHLQHESDW